MRTDAPLHEIDPTIIDAATGGAVPDDFIQATYCAPELADRLSIELDQLWLMVRDGRIPRPVTLPTNPPISAWDIGIIDEWIAAGCPPDMIHVAHQQIVYRRLVDCVRNALSPHPPTITERN